VKYRRKDAKDYARQNLKGIWAASLTPFTQTYQLDEQGLRQNIKHWIHDLGIAGLFVSGKQGEFFSLSVSERKRTFEIAVEETSIAGRTMMSCSDQNLDTVIELAKYSQDIGADFIVVHAPVLHFVNPVDETVYEYYRYIAEQVEIGIAMWSHPDSGYIMSPHLCARLADLPNIVAIKYSVPRATYAELTHLAKKKLIVSSASEEDWLENILELGWQVYLCSTPPFLLQTATDRRMDLYTKLALNGEADRARVVRDSLNPVRKALSTTRPPGKVHAHQKYWLELLGQIGGLVRRPLLQLTDAEKAATRAAFSTCGLAGVGTADTFQGH
jgi:4-hydroxy-tetrahydrodipicolinate synthase